MSAEGSPAGHGAPRLGLVSVFARHPTAGNLLMLIMLLAGMFALSQLNRQFFPDFGIDVISVQVTWPGATAEDAENTIVQVIEPEVRYLDGVDTVTSTASEGVGLVVLEFVSGTDMQRALAEVEQAVSQVTTLPEDSERPVVRRLVRYDTIARIVLSGPYDEGALKALAKQIRDDLLTSGVDRVTFFGSRDEEIRVDLDPSTLRRLDLTLGDIASAIDQSSRDLPAGQLGGAFERQPRALGLARTADDVAAIELRATASGERLEIGDVATVREDFDTDQGIGLRDGQRAIELHVERALTADALEVAERVDAYLSQLEGTLPSGVRVEIYDVVADLIVERIDLLLRNGLGGLVLVLAVLFLFLNARVAFWIGAGIPISLFAMLFVLWLNDQSINMISLFAMLLAVGIIVDDAIVVGEHAAALNEQGLGAQDAAEQGVLRMLGPVTSASLTTIASFLPILVIGGIIGEIMREIPLVVVAVLVASLIECFFVLPSHMRGALRAGIQPGRFRRVFNRGFDQFRAGPFRRTVEIAVAWRYTTLAMACAALIVSLGLIAGGRVGFVFFSAPESDVVYVNLTMAPGTSREATTEALTRIDAAADIAAAAFSDDPDELIVMSVGRLGETVGEAPGTQQLTGDNVGSIVLELLPSDVRSVRIDTFIEAWRQEVPSLPGVESLTLKPRLGGPPGKEVDIRLTGGADVATLKSTALDVQALLARIPGVSEIDDDLPYGKQEVLIRLTPRGRTLGFTTQEVGRQLRDALEGRIAKRFARGDEEVEVVVSLGEASIREISLEDFLLRSPDGREVLLGEVASLEEDRGFARIRRVDGVREIAITAELDEATIKLDQLTEAMMRGGLAEIADAAGLAYRFAGKAEEQRETLGDLRIGAFIGLALIYIILAWVFASFARPLAVMMVIPFGLIGAVLGHLALGYDLSILSMVTLLGLSGILVNDSIILVTAIDHRMAKGLDPIEAVVEGTVSRFRAVLLTSLTTIGGLTPMLFETSQAAQFLIPMAITIVFGLMVTTFLVLFVVPAMVAIQGDVAGLRRRALDSGAGAAVRASG